MLGFLFSNKKSGAEASAGEDLGKAQGLIDLLSNPNDPRYQTLLQQEASGVRRGYLQNIRDLVEENRRQALLGRQQFFDPERRDENIFAAVNRAGQQAQSQARSNVIDNLNNQIARLQNQSQARLNMAQLADQRNNQRRQTILALLGAGIQGAKMASGGGSAVPPM